MGEVNSPWPGLLLWSTYFDVCAEGGGQVVNRGRLVVITTVTDHTYRQNVLEAAAEKIVQINKVLRM